MFLSICLSSLICLIEMSSLLWPFSHVINFFKNKSFNDFSDCFDKLIFSYPVASILSLQRGEWLSPVFFMSFWGTIIAVPSQEGHRVYNSPVCLLLPYFIFWASSGRAAAELLDCRMVVKWLKPTLARRVRVINRVRGLAEQNDFGAGVWPQICVLPWGSMSQASYIICLHSGFSLKWGCCCCCCWVTSVVSDSVQPHTDSLFPGLLWGLDEMISEKCWVWWVARVIDFKNAKWLKAKLSD